MNPPQKNFFKKPLSLRKNSLLRTVSPRKTSSNGNTRFRTDEIYEMLIELVEVSGLPKAFLAQQAGESAGNIDTTIKKLLH